MRLVGFICLSLLATGCLSKESDITDTKLPGKPSDQMVTTEEHFQFFSAGDTDEDHGWNEEANKHAVLFQSYLSTDREKARAEATKIAAARFGEHTRRDEWAEQFFNLATADGVSLLDMRDYCELELQLLTDTDSTKHAKGIKAVQGAVNHFNAMIKALEDQGEDVSKMKGQISF